MPLWVWIAGGGAIGFLIIWDVLGARERERRAREGLSKPADED